jgi:hypothetical protein
MRLENRLRCLQCKRKESAAVHFPKGGSSTDLQKLLGQGKKWRHA